MTARTLSLPDLFALLAFNHMCWERLDLATRWRKQRTT